MFLLFSYGLSPAILLILLRSTDSGEWRSNFFCLKKKGKIITLNQNDYKLIQRRGGEKIMSRKKKVRVWVKLIEIEDKMISNCNVL